MSPRHWRDRLRDILDAIEEIFEFTEGVDEETFAGDMKTRKAVLADFAIIGEAAGRIPEELRSAHTDVPGRSMREMRNVVIHAYFVIEPAIVCETIRGDLPGLATQIRKILEHASEE